MRKWRNQIKIKGQLYDAVEHTDKECEAPRTDGKHLAPADHGFVCLYKNGIYEQWCGGFFAERHQVVKKKKDKFLEH